MLWLVARGGAFSWRSQIWVADWASPFVGLIEELHLTSHIRKTTDSFATSLLEL
jgi:hypothetical protein